MKDVSFWLMRNQKNRGFHVELIMPVRSMQTFITGYTSSTRVAFVLLKTELNNRSNDYNKYLCVSRIRTIFFFESMHFVVFLSFLINAQNSNSKSTDFSVSKLNWNCAAYVKGNLIRVNSLNKYLLWIAHSVIVQFVHHYWLGGSLIPVDSNLFSLKTSS